MKYFVSTGELSGDLHASYICKKILSMDKEAKIYGIGGKNLKKIGIEIFKDIDKLAIMGFVEVLKNIKMLKNTLDETYNFIVDNQIERVILVDYGGFNLKLLEKLKEHNKEIKISYYIPPKVWIWGKKRIHKIKLADEILVIFPWEEEFYRENNIKAHYFGNPFMEKYNKREKKGDKILLLPGSRKQEITSLITPMLEVVREKKEEKFLLKLAKKEDLNLINEDLKNYTNLEVDYEISLEGAAEKSKYAIAASGTVILELAILGLPGVVVYKTSIINEIIAKLIVKPTFITLPNLTLNKEVYVELLQRDCNSKRIMEELSKIENNIQKAEERVEEVREKLNGENIIENYAKVIVEGTSND